MTNTEATLLAAIIGGVIGIVGTYAGAILIANRDRRIDAGRRLREAFQDELASLEVLPIPGEVDAFGILNSAFKKHLIAISEFAHVIPRCKRNLFSQAWQQYHCYPEPPFTHFLEQYDTRTGSIEQRKKNRELAIERIKHILSFAK
jgi:hypothetical protein